MKNSFWHSPRFWLLVILGFAFLTRIVRLANPPGYVFDEVYHAVTSKLIARNDVRAYEWWNEPPEINTAVDWLHPPLAKYTQALGITVFGENSFGWRISSVIFGVLVIAATYRLGKELFDSEPIAVLGAGLASLDGLLLVQSRIAMNDIHVTFMILVALICYLKYRHTNLDRRWLLLTGLSIGVAAATKWSGIFTLGIVVAFELIRVVSNWWHKTKSHSTIKTKLAWIFSLIVLPPLVYVLSYSHMFLQGKSLVCAQQQDVLGECYFERFTWTINGQTHTWFEGYVSHFVELHHQIIWYQTHLEATHPYQSRPWQWALDLRPVWYFVDYLSPAQASNIYNTGNPALFWIGLAAVLTSIWYVVSVVIKHRAEFKKINKDKVIWALSFVTFSYFMVWLPWQLSPRIMFFYHYAPAVPLLALSLSYWLVQLWRDNKRNKKLNWHQKLTLPQITAVLIVLVIAGVFGIWYPLWTNIPVPSEFANQFYFAVPTWK